MARNVGESVLARIRNLSRSVGVDAGVLIRRYAQERLIYRLSVSPEADRYCLKGGMLLAAYDGGNLLRPTQDVDLNGYDRLGNVEHIERSIRIAIATKVADDGIRFIESSMQVRKDRDGKIPGGKVALKALIGSANPDVRVDIGFGNPITPEAPRVIEIPTMLEGLVPRPMLAAYPIETVIAEKLHAMAQFGVFNTRIKDYYDIWILNRLHRIDPTDLAKAVERTFLHHCTEVVDLRNGLSDAFVVRNALAWTRYLQQVAPREGIPFDQVVNEIRALAAPILAVLAQREDPDLPRQPRP